jgi:ABC-type antimicrobial peptide transport system permease subunit
MSDLTPRPRSGLSRNQRERRAYQLVVVGGVAGVIAVVTFVLALASVMSFGPFVLALIVAVLCAWLFRRTVSS